MRDCQKDQQSWPAHLARLLLAETQLAESKSAVTRLIEASGDGKPERAQPVGWPSVSEPKVNCARCRMVPKFDPKVKCCTFHPFVANFALGASLASPSGPESALMRALESLHERGALGLIGVQPGPAIAREEFGQASAGRCSFYSESLNQTGGCSIFTSRPATCATYLCFSERGESHLQALSRHGDALSAWEWSVAHEILWQMGYTKDDLHSKWPLPTLKEIYLRAAQVFAKLTDEELVAQREK